MDILEIKDSFKRNYAEEKEILTNFSNVLKSYISHGEITKTLEDNEFNGVYILNDSEYKEVGRNNSVGFYSIDSRIIVLNAEHYYNNKKIGIHEIGHAFLNGRNRSVINIDNHDIIYGVGLEEGAMSLLMCTNDIKNIFKGDTNVYVQESKIFHQLNTLYGYSNVKEYPNLLIHMLKEPESFITLIRNIYVDIYKSKYENVSSYLLDRSAYDVLVGTDIITEEDRKNCNSIIVAVNFINRLYLSLADENVRDGYLENPYFIKTNSFNKTPEEIFLSILFDSVFSYAERMERKLEALLDFVHMQFETIGDKEYEEKDALKCKTLLLRQN